MLQGRSSGACVIIIVVVETLYLLCPQAWTRSGGGGGDFNGTHTYADYYDYYYSERPSVNLNWLPWIVVGAGCLLLLLALSVCYLCCRRTRPRRQGLRVKLDGD